MTQCSTSVRHTRLDTSAYCSCGRCCGWEWGISLGNLPVYVPLSYKKRASGQRTIPLIPRRRRKLPSGRETAYAGPWDPLKLADHGRGAAVGAGVGLAVGLTALAVKFSLVPGWELIKKGSATLHVPKKQPDWSAARRSLGKFSTLGLAGGAATGGYFLPVRKYWAETALHGMPYYGTTATGERPMTPRSNLLAKDNLTRPWRVIWRVATLQLTARDGTVAADTRHHPFGTRMFIPGYGWGKVTDRGAAITGPDRVDLFHRSHDKALDWGRRKLSARVEYVD